ncbi:MAG: hypothetical protein OEL83_00885 [Desulforhopalus sp.]|nr:hypothetical protein [Desulforhopalus sp.]
MDTNEKNIINLLVWQELLLANLYRLFAKQFPQYCQFFEDLSGDEQKHASWLKQLADSGERGFIVFTEGKVKTQDIDAYNNYLEKVILKTENGELTLAEAVRYAGEMERSLIERDVFSHFDSTSTKAKEILEKLVLETRRHINKIESIQM